MSSVLVHQPPGSPLGAVSVPYRVGGDLTFVAGLLAVDDTGQIVGRGDVRAQARAVFERLRDIVESGGGSLADVVDVFAFVKDPRWSTEVLDEARGFFDPEDAPAWTTAGFVGAWHPEGLVMVKATVHHGAGAKETFTPPGQAWRRGLSMSGAVAKGGLVFVAGQLAVDDEGRARSPFDHVAQSRDCYAGMAECLAHFGASFADVLDFTSFHEDIRGALPTMDEVYIPEIMAGVATEQSATTSHLGSTGLMVKGALGSFHAIADLSGGRRIGCTPDSIWWKGVLPIAGAARKQTSALVTVAGQVSCNPDASIHAPGDPEGQAAYIFGAMQEALAGVGATMADVVEVSSYHKDFRNVPGVLDVASSYFGDNRPAWTAAAVPGLWMEGYLHEVAATAVIRSPEVALGDA